MSARVVAALQTRHWLELVALVTQGCGRGVWVEGFLLNINEDGLTG